MRERIPDEDIRFSVAYAARALRARRLGRVLSEDESRELARAVLAHFQQAGWEVWKDIPPGHSTPS